MITTLDFCSGTLNMYVSSNGNMIPKGSKVDVYTVQDDRDLYVQVCAIDRECKPVKLPFYGTSVEMLLGLRKY